MVDIWQKAIQKMLFKENKRHKTDFNQFFPNNFLKSFYD